MKQKFLEKQLTKITLGKLENLNSTFDKLNLSLNTLPQRKLQGQIASLVNSSKHLTNKPMLYKLQELWRKEHFTDYSMRPV